MSKQTVKKPEKEKAKAKAKAAAKAVQQTAGTTSNSALLASAQPAAAQPQKQSFWQNAKSKLSGAFGKVKTKAASAGNAVLDGGVNLYDKVQNLRDDFHDWKKDTGKKIKTGMSNAKNWVKEKAGNAAKAVKDSALGKKVGSAVDWVKEKLKSDPNKPGFFDKVKNSKFGKAVGAAGSWIGDKAGKAAKAVKESALGKKVGSAVDWVKEKLKSDPTKPGFFTRAKDKLSAAGGWVKEKATAAGGWIKEKAGNAAQAVRDSKFGKAVSSAANTVKESKFGKAVGAAANAVKHKAVSAANWVGNKIHSASEWVNNKKEGVKDWIQDKKDALQQHNERRYLQHRADKKGADYLNKLAKAKADLMKGEIGERIRNRADLGKLQRYDEENRKYRTEEEQKQKDEAAKNASQPAEESGKLNKNAKNTIKKAMGWDSGEDDEEDEDDDEEEETEDEEEGFFDKLAPVKKAKELKEQFEEAKENAVNKFKSTKFGDFAFKAKDKVVPIVKNAEAVRRGIKNVKGMYDSGKDSYDAFKRGNSEAGIMSAAEVANRGAQFGGSFFGNTPIVGAVSGGGDLAEGATKAVIHQKQKSRLDSLDESAVAASGEDAAEKRALAAGRSYASGKVGRDRNNDIAQAVGGGARMIGGILDATGVTGGTGSTIGSVVDKGAKMIANKVNKSNRNKEVKKAWKTDLFGSEEAYKKFKQEHDLTKRDMEILLTNLTGTMEMGDIDERRRNESAQATHKHASDSKVLESLGEKTQAGRESLSVEDIGKHMDVQKDLDTLDKRKRTRATI